MSSLRFAAVIVGVVLAAVSPFHVVQPVLCQGAQHAIVMAAAQGIERKTPDGEWCQRAPVQSQKAHACECHKHNCADPDPDHVSAHTDSQCLNYCTQAQCRCVAMDCP